MNGDKAKFTCPRCGSIMSIDARCCLKCGCLNPNLPENQNMQKFVSDKEKSLYQVGSLETIKSSSGGITNSIASKTGNIKACFWINYLIYMLIIVLSFFLILGNRITDFNAIKNSSFADVALITSIVFLYVYSMELIFIKSNKKWWYSLVPFYNLFILCEIVFKKKWLGVLLLIPIIGQIFFLVVLYKLAAKFKYNGILAVLFPVIYIPLMGFGSRLYEDVNYVYEDLTLEKDYKRKRLFFMSLLIFGLIGGGFVFWNNIIDIKSKAFKITNYYYVFASKQIVNKTDYFVNNNLLECEKYDYNDQSGMYYIEYADIGDITYLPFRYYRDVISGYVVLINEDGKRIYYVSLSDGTYGFPETLNEDVKIESVVSYEKLIKRKDLNKCKIIKNKTSTVERKILEKK